MFPTRIVLQALLILTFLHNTQQVDISLQWWSEGMDLFHNLVTAHWYNAPPGSCCKPHYSQLPSLHHHQAGATKFVGLRQNQLGAGWAASGYTNNDIINCTGAPILRVFGPGAGDEDSIVMYNPPWEEAVEGTFQNVVYAASWVDLRLRFPPDSAGSRYLQWQGVKRAVWGMDTWSAASDGITFPKRRRRDWLPRLNGQAERGTAFISPPIRWVYPDVYTVNGTNYARHGNETYVSKLGEVLETGST